MAVAWGRIDIIYDTVVILWYQPASPKGHLSNIQHLYGYLNKYTSTYIKSNTETSDYENFKIIEGNWGNLYAGEPKTFRTHASLLWATHFWSPFF